MAFIHIGCFLLQYNIISAENNKKQLWFSCIFLQIRNAANHAKVVYHMHRQVDAEITLKVVQGHDCRVVHVLLLICFSHYFCDIVTCSMHIAACDHIFVYVIIHVMLSVLQRGRSWSWM